MQNNSEELRNLVAGKEVIIVSPDHPKCGAVGVTVGLANTIDVARIRVVIDGDIYLCGPTDLIEN